MRIAGRYDVICAGSGLSSYLSGALLAKSGLKVLLIDSESQPLIDPHSQVLFGLQNVEMFRKNLEDLGLGDEWKKCKLFQSVSQVLLPEKRVFIGLDPSVTKKEFEREISSHSSEAWRFFERFYEASKRLPHLIENVLRFNQGDASEQRQWKDFWGPLFPALRADVKKRFRDLPIPSQTKTILKEFERIAMPMLGSLSFCSPQNFSPEHYIRSLPIFLKGGLYPEGGVRTLQQKLLQVVRDSGGDIKQHTSIEALIATDRNVNGVLMSSHEGMIYSDVVVLSEDHYRLYKTLPKPMQDPVVVRSLSKIVPTHWRYSLSLKVKKQYVPVGASESMSFVASEQHPLEEENFLTVQILSSNDLETEILVTALVPSSKKAFDYLYLQKLSGRMLQVFKQIFPFFEEALLSITPDPKKGPEEIKRVYFSEQGSSALPQSLFHYGIWGADGLQDFSSVAWNTPHPNLYFVGRPIYPVLGAFSEVFTSNKVAEDILSSRKVPAALPQVNESDVNPTPPEANV